MSASRRTTSTLLAILCVWVAVLGVANADGRRSSAPTIVQALNPTGLRISVPDEPGTDVVIINANINLPIDTRETGQVSGSVLEAKNGFWTLEARDTTLKPGDVVFFWVYTAKGDTGDRVAGNQPIRELVEPSCRPSPTTVNGRTACQGELIFEDNFDTLNTSIWKHFIQFSDDPDIDFTTYNNNPENSFVKDGKLHLKATVLTAEELQTPTKLEGCTWQRDGAHYCERKPIGWDILPPTRSAMLTTKDTFSFKFGRIDIRAKSAAGDWLLSRAQLDPQTGSYGRNTFESGRLEIMRTRGNADFVETDGKQAGGLMNIPQADIATCHRRLSIYKVCELQFGKLYSDEMHLYSVTWTPDHITITIDGECVHRIEPPTGSFLEHGYFKENCNDSPWEKGTRFVPFDKEFYVQFYLMVGGFYIYQQGSTSGGNPKPWSDDDPKAKLNFWKAREVWQPTWKSDLEVDYVKVWAL